MAQIDEIHVLEANGRLRIIPPQPRWASRASSSVLLPAILIAPEGRTGHQPARTIERQLVRASEPSAKGRAPAG